MTSSKHFPVMLREVVEISQPENGGYFLDCTFGGGGYSKKILSYPDTKVIAIDRDPTVKKDAKKLENLYPNRFKFFNKKFSQLDSLNKDKKFDVIIFDLGVSMLQLLDHKRGFSFNSKESLEMQMGLSSVSGLNVINKIEKKTLFKVIKFLGEEKDAANITNNIIKERSIKKIEKAADLDRIISKSKKKNYRNKIKPSTKTFQSLRIFVNKELTELIEGLNFSAKSLKPGGKVIIISFHSLEDRIIKFFFKYYSSARPNSSRYFPVKNDKTFLFENQKKNIFKPDLEEIKKNKASRSAKLRFGIRTQENFQNLDYLKKTFIKYTELENINVKS